MIVSNMIIRSSEQLMDMDYRIVNALEILVKRPKLEIPIVYQYLHNRSNDVIVDSDTTIGKVTKLRRNGHGDIICDCMIEDMKSLSVNFQGMIDNMVVVINPENMHTEVKAFIVYDKEAKEKIDKSIEEKSKNIKLPKPGEVPLHNNVNMDDINGKLRQKMKDFFNGEGDDNNG